MLPAPFFACEQGHTCREGGARASDSRQVRMCEGNICFYSRAFPIHTPRRLRRVTPPPSIARAPGAAAPGSWNADLTAPAQPLAGFPIVLAKFTLLRNYTFFYNEF